MHTWIGNRWTLNNFDLRRKHASMHVWGGIRVVFLTAYWKETRNQATWPSKYLFTRTPRVWDHSIPQRSSTPAQSFKPLKPSSLETDTFFRSFHFRFLCILLQLQIQFSPLDKNVFSVRHFNLILCKSYRLLQGGALCRQEMPATRPESHSYSSAFFLV